MKQVGRTPEEIGLAQQSLLKAISLDSRHEIPEIQLHRALMLMDGTDTSKNAEAIGALQNYITAYERKRATTLTNQNYLPPNLDVIYGYMRLLGDKTWTAPSVSELPKAAGTGLNTPAVQPAMPASLPRTEPVSPSNTRKISRP
jgi:hypothetical protein